MTLQPYGSAWVRRGGDGPPAHECGPPDDGRRGDLWRCNEGGCGRLLRLALACDTCDVGAFAHGGQCVVGLTWRRARFGQRVRYWRRGWVAR